MSLPISGFTAIPNPQMPAFLGAQSFIMMYQAGEGWQFGKRRISAMKNEDFNKLTPMMLMERQAMELKGAIPIIEKSMDNMTRMIPMMMEQFGDFTREAIKAIPQTVANVFSGTEGGQRVIQGGGAVASFIGGTDLLLAQHKTQNLSGAGGVPLSTYHETRKQNDLVDAMFRSMKNMSRSVASETAKQLPFMGFTATNFKKIGDALLQIINKSVGSTGKASGDKVGVVNRRWKGTSTQSLKIERNSLIRQIRGHTATLAQKSSFNKTSRGRQQFVTIERSTLGKLSRAQQKLADILLELQRRR